MVTTAPPAPSNDDPSSGAAEGLPAAYEEWRNSRLGQITDALEERLLLDMLGPVRGLAVLCFVRDTERAMSEIARVLKPGGRFVIGELGRWSSWAAIRRVKGWFGSSTWKAVRFRSARDLRSLVESCGLDVNKTVGAIYYPHIGIAARLLACFDSWCARRTSIGAAFIAVLAIKHSGAGAFAVADECEQRIPNGAREPKGGL